MRDRKAEIKAREEKRYEELRNCTTPEELSFAVWTMDLENAMQSSRDCYRKPFVQWIEEYAQNKPHEGWKYNTPRELAEDIWKVFDEEYFKNLQQILITWIEQYKTKYKINHGNKNYRQN
jgi:hypothetical protein